MNINFCIAINCPFYCPAEICVKFGCPVFFVDTCDMIQQDRRTL